MKKQIKPCPRCGDSVGWWEKRKVSYDQYYWADGEPSHTVDGNTQAGRRCHCFNCDQDVTKCVKET